MSEELWTAVDSYVTDLLLGSDEVLAAALADSAAAGLPDIAVSAAHGRLLTLLARATGARRILEIGTLGGYSAIWL
ncbi:MAG TPA: methyltransferase, partial [Promineifilum sp.]|nr:methyltransferase [Promineifilum sp.]